MGVVLAIDFGSSNTAAAYRDADGLIHEIRLSATSTLMPSAVLYTPEKVLVGRAALQTALTNPFAFEPAPKRRLADGHIILGDELVEATVLIAAVLADVVAKAVRVTGETPEAVVLTHPDKWGPGLRQQLVDAALSAGISDPKLVSEATAAAWFYTATAPDLPVGARLAVFDFGAGTCDVAVIDKRADGSFAVVAADGVEGLGGQDLDARIHAWVRRQLDTVNPQLRAEISDPANTSVQLNLADRIRDAKETLSEAQSAAVVVSGAAGNAVLQLTRGEFEQLISGDIDRAVDLTNRVLNEANTVFHADGPVTIYLTGGSSLIPLIHTRLSALGTIATLGDPKTVVARGALRSPETAESSAPVQSPTPVAVTSTAPVAVTPPSSIDLVVPQPLPAPEAALVAPNAQPVAPEAPSAEGQARNASPAKPTPRKRTSIWAAAAIAVAVVVVATFVALRPDGNGSNGARPNASGSTTVDNGPFTGSYTASFGAASTMSGTPVNGSVAASGEWSFRSHCGSSGCVATSNAGDAPTLQKSFTFDEIDGAWVAVGVTRVTSQPSIPGFVSCPLPTEYWEIAVVEPRPDGSFVGSYDVISAFDCGEEGTTRPVTLTSGAAEGTDVANAPNPATRPPRVSSPAEALRGRYKYTYRRSGGDPSEYLMTARTNCLRTGDRCISYLDDGHGGFYPMTYANLAWMYDVDVETLCTLDDVAVRERGSVRFPLPEPRRDPIVSLTGEGSDNVSGGSACDGASRRTVTIERVGD